jgi:phosphatidylinositol alpha-1,6-mannosyltransferase
VPDSDRAELYRGAQVFAMPSRGEGFGLVYLEAMAHGLPCIGSTHDAAGEVIADGITGYLTPQADIAGLAARVLDLLTDESRRRAMGESGRTRVASLFTYRHFAGRLLTLLDGVADGLAAARRSA